MKETLQVGSLYLDDTTNKLLKAMLGILQHKTSVFWHYVESPELLGRGLLFVNPLHPQSNAILLKYRRARNVLCVVLAKPDEQTPADVMKVDLPLRVMQLLDTLEAAGNALLARQEPFAKTASVPPVTATDNNDNLLSLLRRLRKQPHPGELFVVTVPDLPPLYILPQAKKYLFEAPPDALKTLNDTTQFTVETRSADDAVAIALAERGKPLAQFLWSVGVHWSNNYLLPWLEDASTFRLKRWLDFRKIEHLPGHLDVAAHLTRTPADLDTIMDRTGVSRHVAVTFINACALCGYLEVTSNQNSRTTAAVTPEIAQKRSLFARIRSKLGITSRAGH